MTARRRSKETPCGETIGILQETVTMAAAGGMLNLCYIPAYLGGNRRAHKNTKTGSPSQNEDFRSTT
jgi:hypothetical protein